MSPCQLEEALDIIFRVAGEYRLDPEELASRKSSPDLDRARGLAIGLMVNAGITPAELDALFFGGDK
jgi:hypothetical protein